MTLVTKQWLLARMYEPDLAIIDCRFQMGQPEAGQVLFQQEHIPGAIHLDLEKELSSPVTTHGGRHPLPPVDQIVQTLSRLGLNRSTRIVAYDDQGGMMAARLWWMLKYLGHAEVYILKESFSTWKEAGYPISSDQPVRIPSTYEPDVQGHLLVPMQEVKDKLHAEGTVLIDSREPRRYLGLEEPLDKAAGHIPGAVNKFWQEVKDASGSWKSQDALKEHFSDIPEDKEIIVYCGSGVSACPNVIALLEAGYTNVRLYAGSWSDWISYRENPIATGEE